MVLPKDINKIVLDPFMGSGTTAIAAIENSVSFLGFEINPEYCQIAQKRVKDHLNKTKNKLF